jgi:signal transduction histidine kinase
MKENPRSFLSRFLGIALYIFLIAGLTTVDAQTSTLDSLLSALPAMQEDTNKVLTLVQVSRQYLALSDYANSGKCVEQMQTLSERLNFKKGIAIADAHSGLIDYYGGYFSEAQEKFRNAISIFQQMNFRRGIADNYTNLGLAQMAQGNLSGAIESYSIALGFREEHDKRGRSAAYNNIGTIYHHQGDYPNALKYYLMSVQIDEELGDKLDLAFSYNNLGLFYQHQEKEEEAIDYFRKANMLCREIGHKECIAGTNSNIATLYKTQGNYQQSLNYHLGSLDVFREIENRGAIAGELNNVGLMYHLLGQDSSALLYLLQAMNVHEELGDVHGKATALLNMGEVYTSLGQHDEARKHLESAIQLSSRIDAKENITASYLSLIQLDSITGNYQQALEHFRKYTLFKDSMLNEKGLQSIAELESKYETEKKDREIDRLENERSVQELQYELQAQSLNQIRSEKERLYAENLLSLKQIDLFDKERQLKNLRIEKDSAELIARRAENRQSEAQVVLLDQQNEIKDLRLKEKTQLQYYMAIAFILLTILGGFAYAHYFTKQKLKLQMLRNKIASDLHDDVGSTLSSISIFSEMAQKQSKEVIPALQTIGESSRKMLDAMADIVWTINPENDQFEKILLRMRNFAYDLLGAKKIDFEFKAHGDTSNLKLPMEVRKNLFLIFKEATNNMVKYSEANKAAYSIKNENDHLVMQIRDNGKGFDVSKTPAGNGLKNMRKRAEEIGGILSIDSLPGNGTTILFRVAV